LGGVKIHEARTVRLPRSIADELGGYLAGRPNDADDLVFTAPLGGSSRSAELLVAEAEEVGFEPAVEFLRRCRLSL
jgi:hypothetical protein